MTRNKIILLSLTLAATIFATWNIIDEYHQLQSWQNVAIFIGVWLALPYLNCALGLFRSKPNALGVNIALAFAYAALYTSYALNGSTANREEGAQHVHLITVPVLTLILTMGIVALVFVLRQVRSKRPTHSENTA